jgi:hypothetical protein
MDTNKSCASYEQIIFIIWIKYTISSISHQWMKTKTFIPYLLMDSQRSHYELAIQDFWVFTQGFKSSFWLWDLECATSSLVDWGVDLVHCDIGFNPFTCGWHGCHSMFPIWSLKACKFTSGCRSYVICSNSMSAQKWVPSFWIERIGFAK